MEAFEANTMTGVDVVAAETTVSVEEVVSPMTMSSTAHPESSLEDMASPVIEDVDSTVVLKEEKPVEEIIDAALASPESALEGKAPPVIEETDSAIVLKEEKPVEDAIIEANESPIEDTTSPMIEEVDSSDNSAINLEEEKPVEEVVDEASPDCPESSLEAVPSPMIEEDNSPVDLKEEKPVVGAINEVCLESPIEGMISPMIKEVYSFFVDSSVVLKKEDKPAKEAHNEVSCSAPVATEQELEVVKNQDEIIAKLNLSGYFPSLEDRLPSSLLDVIYWRQPIISGAVFSSLFIFLLSCSLFSFISVTAYVSMMGLGAIMSYVLFKKIATAVQRTGEMIAAFVQKTSEKLRSIDRDIEKLVTAEDLRNIIQASLDHTMKATDVPRSLFLHANLSDFIKWAAFLWTMAYIGGMVNLVTLLIVALVLIFIVPKTYEVYGSQIDVIASKLMAKWPVIHKQVVEPLLLIKEKAIAAIPIGKEKSA